MTAMNWFIQIVTILFGILFFCYVSWKKSNKLKKLGILHRRPWPFIGNSAAMMLRRAHFTEMINSVYEIHRDAEYVGFYDFSQPIIMIRSPELIKSIAVKNFDHFTDHLSFFDADLDPMFSKNLFGLRGEEWKDVRNLLTPAFTGSKMKTMFKLMSNCADNFVNHLVNVTSKDSNVIDSKEIFTRYTNDVIATCAFGINIDSMKNPKNDFYILGKRVTNFDGFQGIKIFFSRMFPKVAKLLDLKFVPLKVEKFFENVLSETIETRDREGITRPDMIQLMMESRGKKSYKGPKLTIQDMTAQAFIFFFGGFDSTSTLMCFVALELAAYPDVQAKLHDELDNVLKATNGEVNYDAVNGMQYLDAVINETLRLYPVAPFLERLCVKAFELPPALPGGKSITIEPGQSVWFPAFSIHRDPKYFPRPHEFDPERFMGNAKFDINPCTYFPFGQGPRMCIGNRFALLETKVLFFHLLKKCYLKTSPKTILPLEFDKSSFAMRPKGGFWLKLEPRNT